MCVCSTDSAQSIRVVVLLGVGVGMPVACANDAYEHGNTTSNPTIDILFIDWYMFPIRNLQNKQMKSWINWYCWSLFSLFVRIIIASIDQRFSVRNIDKIKIDIFSHCVDWSNQI